jgi:ABC-type glycerol-3-phosphate transport system substrate-binding protein
MKSLSVLAVILSTYFISFAETSEKPRVLHVGVYPFVPEIAQMELKIEQDFEANHPGVRVEFVDLGDDYYGTGLDSALRAKPPKVDVVEVDTVFLQDLVNAKLVEPLTQDALQPEGTFLPVASKAATF